MQGQLPNFNLAAAKQLDDRVWSALKANRARDAVDLCASLNREFPAFAPGWHTASHVAIRIGRPQTAVEAIDRALQLEPDKPAWLLQKASCLIRLNQFDDAAKLADVLLETDLETPYQRSSLGLLLTELGRRRDAVAQYARAAELQPEESKHYFNMACLQRTIGDLDKAEVNFDRTIAIDPSDYEAWKLRSELRRQTSASNHVSALKSALGKAENDKRGAVQLLYALAKELEDLEQYDESFDCLKRGADMRRNYMQYDLQRDLDTMKTIRETFDASVVRASTDGFDNDEPIFILGMPRTGTTLVDRILSSHTEVFSAGELNNFAVELMRLVRPLAEGRQVSRDDIVRLSAEIDFARLGEAYIASTRPGTGHTGRFIDKLPLNFLYTGLIHRALPKAKIVHVRRDPIDTCYAIYKQLFVDAYPFSYDLEELGKYYAAYHELMTHWHEVLPGIMHVVEYEKLVSDLEGEARKLVEFCGLEWQPECLRYYDNEAASTTASAAQIRQPVYQSSVGKWRRYERQFAPLVATLIAASVPFSD